MNEYNAVNIINVNSSHQKHDQMVNILVFVHSFDFNMEKVEKLICGNY